MLARTRFMVVCAALFVACMAVTVSWCTSMPAMGGAAMPAGCTMSMASMPMPRSSWAGEAAAFIGMWVVMMVAMMLPVLVPMLERYRGAVGGRVEARLACLTVIVGAGYFAVWTVFGLAVIPVRAALQAIERQQPALAGMAPIAAATVVVVAGVFQFTRWKSRQLDCCRRVPRFSRRLEPDAATAWRHGLKLGLDCCGCCANLMIVMLVIGAMDLGAMAVVTAAMTVERLAPGRWRVAGAIGVATIGAGLVMLARIHPLG